MTLITSVRDLNVFKMAYASSLEIYKVTKSYPKEERYDLTSQIRRSSKSVAANILEAWRRRRYPKNFVSKLNDAETEADETILWLDMSFDLGYLDKLSYDALRDKYEHILAMLVNMIRNPEKWKVN
jgi:four helix bundle protein